MVKALNCHDMYHAKVLCQGGQGGHGHYSCAPMCTKVLVQCAMCNVQCACTHVHQGARLLVSSIHDQFLSCAVIAILENAICSGMKNASM